MRLCFITVKCMSGDCFVDDRAWRTSVLQAVLEQTREGANKWDAGDLR